MILSSSPSHALPSLFFSLSHLAHPTSPLPLLPSLPPLPLSLSLLCIPPFYAVLSLLFTPLFPLHSQFLLPFSPLYPSLPSFPDNSPLFPLLIFTFLSLYLSSTSMSTGDRPNSCCQWILLLGCHYSILVCHYSTPCLFVQVRELASSTISGLVQCGFIAHHCLQVGVSVSTGVLGCARVCLGPSGITFPGAIRNLSVEQQ